MRKRRAAALGLAAIAAVGCNAVRRQLGDEEAPRNVIFVMGDGMGPGQIHLARNQRYGPSGRLNFERLPVIGLVSTFAADGQLITDSAAAATAMATGHKTALGRAGVDPSGASCKNLIEAASAAGYATGLLDSAYLTNATIAGFATHVTSREDFAAIEQGLLESPADLLIGGTHHLRDDGSGFDFLERARQRGYDVVIGQAAFLSAKRLPVLALVDGMDSYPTSRTVPGADAGEPSFVRSVGKALELLSSARKGFFFFLEDDAIDSFGHDNSLEGVIAETLRLDDAVEVILDFARRDRHTLVIVTADHETGGLTIVDPSTVDGGVSARWSTGEHSGSPVPLYAYGPGAHEFAGTMDNTDLARRVGRVLGLDGFPAPCSAQSEVSKRAQSAATPAP